MNKTQLQSMYKTQHSLASLTLLTQARSSSPFVLSSYIRSTSLLARVTMRALFFLLIARYSARALPATQASSLLRCTRDALFTSLFRDGRHFCASVVSDRCGKGSTPTQFATYDPDVLYSHVSLSMDMFCLGQAWSELTLGIEQLRAERDLQAEDDDGFACVCECD